MPKVFIVNEPDPSRSPHGRPVWDVSPASHFGEIVYIFPAGDPPPVRNREEAYRRANEVLSQASGDDYLVWAGGDPFGMILAAGIMADYTDGKFNYLMWDRGSRVYAPIPVDMYNLGE